MPVGTRSLRAASTLTALLLTPSASTAAGPAPTAVLPVTEFPVGVAVVALAACSLGVLARRAAAKA